MSQLKSSFEKNGFVSPISIVDLETANSYRNILENVEQKIGHLNYRYKIHTALDFVYKLATNERLLDKIEELLGPNILIYNASFVIKEPNTKTHISWHQDLTYWGFNDDKQVAAWVALSDASEESGCMHMIPESHKNGQIAHKFIADKNNLLHHGQTIENVSEDGAVSLPLRAGEASLHHGWTMHTSYPNKSSDRRIGLNINYISTDMYQTQTNEDSAMLVRGIDNYNHFKSDSAPKFEFDEQAWIKLQVKENLIHQTYNKMKKNKVVSSDFK
jgi:ectoine hydroxylase-related dioxygenase (phytanoyl-CoA dioxygenase family)